MAFVNHLASVDDNWLSWVRFLLEDLVSYMSLYIEIRTRSWDLCTAGIKDSIPCLLHLTDQLTEN